MLPRNGFHNGARRAPIRAGSERAYWRHRVWVFSIDFAPLRQAEAAAISEACSRRPVKTSRQELLQAGELRG